MVSRPSGLLVVKVAFGWLARVVGYMVAPGSGERVRVAADYGDSMIIIPELPSRSLKQIAEIAETDALSTVPEVEIRAEKRVHPILEARLKRTREKAKLAQKEAQTP